MSGEIQRFVALLYLDYHCIFQGPSRWIRPHVILETKIKLSASITNACLSFLVTDRMKMKTSADSPNLASP